MMSVIAELFLIIACGVGFTAGAVLLTLGLVGLCGRLGLVGLRGRLRLVGLRGRLRLVGLRGRLGVGRLLGVRG